MAFIIDIYIRKLLLLEQIEQFGETHEWIMASVTKDYSWYDQSLRLKWQARQVTMNCLVLLVETMTDDSYILIYKSRLINK